MCQVQQMFHGPSFRFLGGDGGGGSGASQPVDDQEGLPCHTSVPPLPSQSVCGGFKHRKPQALTSGVLVGV